MADRLRWGILATGGIARQFAGGLKLSKTGTLLAVGSRTLDRATAFTDEFGGRPYASYEEVLADPEVDAVYIATPHHLHEEWTVKAAEAGKGILCEKPFTLNAFEAERALAAVRANDVFFMEAFMYRCHPQTHKLRELLEGGAIGELQAIHAEFSFGAGREWSNFRTDGAVGGGGLMDVGVYPISLSRYAVGEEPEIVHYAAHMSPKGYDEWGAGAMRFPGGVTATFTAGIHCNMNNDAWFYGTEGKIHIGSPWKVYPGTKLTVHKGGQAPEAFDFGTPNDQLYGIEADAVAEYFEAKECPHMTLADTLGNMRTLDRCRASAGISFAMEARA